MAEQKTKLTKASVPAFLAAIPDPRRGADAKAVAKLIAAATGEKAAMWGASIVGYGRYKYVYASGHSGESCITGFSPRKTSLVLYLSQGFPERAALLKKLGKHKTGVGCVYINRLEDIDAAILTEMITRSHAWVIKKYGSESGAAP